MSRYSLAVLILLISQSAQAVPIGYEFTGIFNDGGSVAGSFVYDADIDEYSAVAIVTTAGSHFGGWTYDEPHFQVWVNNFQFAALDDVSLADYTDVPAFYLMFGGYLTNAGTPVHAFIVAEGVCQNAVCDTITPLRRIESMLVNPIGVNSVPEPSSLLFLTGGLVLTWYVRRRRLVA